MKFPTINFAGPTKRLSRLISDNSPVILTGLGAVGVVATGFLTHQAGVKAEQTLAAHAETLKINSNAEHAPVLVTRDEFTTQMKIELTWKLYLAPAAVGISTIAAIIAAQKINASRAAAIAGVLAWTQEDIREYKAKVQEKMTGPQHKKMQDEIAAEKVEQVVAQHPGMIPREGEQLFVELLTMRPFISTRNKIEAAQNEINRRMMGEFNDSSCMSEFYDMLDLEHTSMSDDFGWNIQEPLDINFTPIMTKNGYAAVGVAYMNDPTFRPWVGAAKRGARD